MIDEQNSVVQHDYLESYFMWKEFVKFNPEKFAGLSFPISYGKWANMMRTRKHDICPICKQVGSYIRTYEGIDHEFKCLCNVASWTYQQEQMTSKWKDPFEFTPWGRIIPTREFSSIAGKAGNEVVSATENTLSALGEFCSGRMRWHLLRGYFGCGKSTMLKMVATELYPIATYVTAGNLKNHFRTESLDGDITELIKAFSKVRILLLDDIGMEYDGSGFTSKTLRNIIDNRMAFPFKFPTITTTNMSLEESDLAFGKNPDDTKAIVSRFLDPRYCDVHLLFQGDARRVGYTQKLASLPRKDK
jgi:hypothetical protein